MPQSSCWAPAAHQVLVGPSGAGCKGKSAEQPPRTFRGWGDLAVCVQNVLRAPLLAFQPPHLSPFPCWALARCPSHVSAWESPPAFSFNAAESLGSWLHGASSGLPVRGLSSTCGTAEPVAVGVCTLLAIPPRGLDVPWQPAGPESTGSARQPGALLAQALPCHLSRPVSSLQAWGAPWWPDCPTA